MTDEVIKTNKGPFVLMWQVADPCVKAWQEWGVDNHVKVMDDVPLHMTQFYAKTESSDHDWPDVMNAAFTVKPNGVAKLGKALVVMFDAPQFINARFQQLKTNYSHSFPTLIPHMSLIYDQDVEDGIVGRLNDVEKPSITFNREIIESIVNIDKAELQFMETSGLYSDLMDTASSDETNFRQYVRDAMSNELESAWKSGDYSAYTSKWAETIRAIPFVRK